MPLEINAQFNRFVQFAQQQQDGGAVARTAPEPEGVGARAGRAVSAALDDKYGAFKRSVKIRDRNNETRNLFRQSVNAIFGGAENLPQGVKDAMRLRAYDNRGTPLTARNILAVHKAILQYKAAVEVDRAAEQLDDLLLASMFRERRSRPLKLSSAQRQTAVRAVAKCTRDVSGKALRILANFVAIAAARGDDPDVVAQQIQKVVAPVRNTRPGDGRLAELERQLLVLAREQLARGLAREKKEQDDPDGLSGAFDQASPRNPVTIDGQECPDATSAAEAFKAKIGPGHRKAIALFFSRMGNAPVVAMSKRAAPYDEAMKQPGAERFASFDASAGSCFESWPVEVADPKRSIAVSEDGKRATLTVETPASLKYGLKGSGEDAALPTGSIVWKQEFVFDLDVPDAVLAEARLGQTLDV